MTIVPLDIVVPLSNLSKNLLRPVMKKGEVMFL